jgi:hypothetical protein
VLGGHPRLITRSGKYGGGAQPLRDTFTRREPPEPLAPRPDSEPLHHLDRLAARSCPINSRSPLSAFTAPGSDQVVANRFTEQRRGQVPEDDASTVAMPISVAAMIGRGRR